MRWKFGEIRQLGFVVRDAHAAMRYWTQIMGVGPFFVVEGAQFGNYRYRGESAPSPVLTLGYAQAGHLQIEIIAQQNDSPSGYLEFLQSGREGLQHVSSWFDNAAAFDATYRDAAAAGVKVIHEGSAGGPRFAYFATDDGRPDGLSFEIAEGLLPELASVHTLLKEAAQSWDGSNPIRPMPRI